MGKRIEFSKEVEQEIIRLYTEEYLSVDKIIKKLNLECGNNTINRLLRNNNVTIRSIGESRKIYIPYERLYNLYIVQNLTQKQIAEKIGCCENKIYRLLKEYNIEKYIKQIVETREQTCLERLGVEHPLQNKDVQEKHKKTCLERLGVEHPLQNKDVQEKHKKTCKEKYDCENPSQRHISPDKIEIYTNKNNLINYLNSIDYEERTSSFCSEDLGISISEFNVYIRNYNIFNLVNHSKSEWENETKRWFESNYPNLNVQYNDWNIIKPKELDIYIPEYNIAIELNGSYFHQDKERELIKEQLCKEKGITLYTIWDYELNENNTLEDCLKRIINTLQ